MFSATVHAASTMRMTPPMYPAILDLLAPKRLPMYIPNVLRMNADMPIIAGPKTTSSLLAAKLMPTARASRLRTNPSGAN